MDGYKHQKHWWKIFVRWSETTKEKVRKLLNENEQKNTHKLKHTASSIWFEPFTKWYIQNLSAPYEHIWFSFPAIFETERFCSASLFKFVVASLIV